MLILSQLIVLIHQTNRSRSSKEKEQVCIINSNTLFDLFHFVCQKYDFVTQKVINNASHDLLSCKTPSFPAQIVLLSLLMQNIKYQANHNFMTLHDLLMTFPQLTVHARLNYYRHLSFIFL